MIKKIVSSVGIQMIGTLSSLLLVWMITRFYGISTQGQFVLIKSWVDLAVVFASFGLPQSFIFAINKLNISWQYLEKFTFRYIPVVFLICLFATYIWFEYLQEQNFLDIYNYLYLAVGVGGLTGFSLLRGLYLTKNDGNKFALVTIAPNILLFVTFLVILFLFKNQLNISLLYMISGVFSFIIVMTLLSKFRINIKAVSVNEIPWKAMVGNGFNVFIQSIFASLLPLGTYWLMSKFGFNNSEIGVLSIAFYVYLVFTLPLAMVAPIFYNRWSNSKDIQFVKLELLRFVKFGFLLIPILFIAYWLLPLVLPITFGNQVISSITPARLLLIATFALYYNNLMSCFLLSQGKFIIMSITMIIKTVFCYLVLILTLVTMGKSLNFVAISWVFSEILVFITLLFMVMKYANN